VEKRGKEEIDDLYRIGKGVIKYKPDIKDITYWYKQEYNNLSDLRNYGVKQVLEVACYPLVVKRIEEWRRTLL
jgi:hypothetical protein